MMANLNTDELITQKHKRNFVQWGGPRPGNSVQFAGQDTQYMSIDGASASESGGVDPIWVHKPERPGQYKLAGRTISPPDLPEATLVLRERHGMIPRQLFRFNCQFNLYELTGTCKSLADFVGGWTDYVMIYSNAIVNEKDLGSRTGFDSDDPIEDQLSLTLSAIYPIGSIGFGEGAATQIDREVAGITYGEPQYCVGCSDGTEYVYAVTKPSGAGSPGLPAEVVYTLNGGLTWNQVNIDGLGATEETYDIGVVGSYLVVLGNDAYYYATINSNTGVPGTFTKVSTGFEAAGSPKDMYVAGPREVYFVGDGGYVYRSTDITSGVSILNAGVATTENLLRIHGSSETIVAVGENGTVIKSDNRGTTWATTTASPSAADIQAVSVLDTRRYWVGTSTGYIYYTLDTGETWSSLEFPDKGTGSIQDIVFATDEVGYFSHSTATPAARLYATWNGGVNWTREPNRILNYPTFDHGRRIAVPLSGDPATDSNTVAVGGLAGDGTDGIVIIGTTGKF